MRAWRVNEVGDPETVLRLERIADPRPGPGEVAIAVEAGTMNFADILLCQGIYQDRPGVPFTPGLETCGRIEAVGAGVDLAVGDRVAGMAALPAGGYAEKALLRAPTALAMPDDVAAADATLLYSTYQTAHVGLHHRGRLQPGEWLLVHGAAGGVGSAAVQLGAAAGATVIATAGGPAKVDAARRSGAHHVIDHRRDDVHEQVMALTGGRGVDVAFDPVGGELGEATRRMIAWEGRLVVIGFASGNIPSYPANHLLVKNYAIIGLHWGAMAEHGGRPVIEAAHDDLLRLYRSGAIRPDIEATVGLDDVLDGLARLAARDVVGRLVLTPSQAGSP